MYDARTRHGREVLDDVRTRFGLEVLDPPIPKSVRFAEAPGRGLSILEHAPRSAGSAAYRAIAAVLHSDLRDCATVTGNLRDFSAPSQRPGRDPSGKRALFSAGAHDSDLDTPPTAATEAAEPAPPERTAPDDPPRPGTLVVECATCGRRTRVTYFDFALLNLPFGFVVPIPGRRYKHRMTCPACSRWTWVDARWRD